jgi:hypothetical protein
MLDIDNLWFKYVLKTGGKYKLSSMKVAVRSQGVNTEAMVEVVV